MPVIEPHESVLPIPNVGLNEWSSMSLSFNTFLQLHEVSEGMLMAHMLLCIGFDL